MEPLLSAREVARAFGVPRKAVSAAVRVGDLRAYRLGTRRFLIDPADVQIWIRGHAVRPTVHAERIVARVLDREAAE